MKDFLSVQDREDLSSRHRRERDHLIADRIKAVLLKDKGWTYPQRAEALMLDEKTISHQVEEYLKKQKLKPENSGSSSKLDSFQIQGLINYLETRTYVKASDICAYVLFTYGMTYSRKEMTDWLHVHGLSYKKLKGLSPAKVDLLKQEAFIQYYEKFLTTKPEDKSIIFMDSALSHHSNEDCLLVDLASLQARCDDSFKDARGFKGGLNLEGMKVMNQPVRNNQFFHSAKEFREAIIGFCHK